jgi:SAM-dependent methyltransferase
MTTSTPGSTPPDVSDSPEEQRSRGFTNASVPEVYQRILAPVVFEPWAEILVRTAAIAGGDRILDVASGTGAVARRAAAVAGETGHVTASDLSPAMLARSAAYPTVAGSAPIEFLEAAAEAVPEGGFDAVLCQQGLQFFPDKPAALLALRRALGPGGRLALAVWATGHRLEPFQDYGEALEAIGTPPPFPGAFNPGSFTLGPEHVSSLLAGAGFESIEVRVVEYETVWADARTVSEGILGTPFGPQVLELTDDRRAALDAELGRRFGAPGSSDPIRRTTVAVVALAR